MVDHKDILPDIEDLYLAHPVEAMRPAVAYAAEIGGVTPPQVLGGVIAAQAFYVSRNEAELARHFNADHRIQTAHQAWSKDAEAQLASVVPLKKSGEEARGLRFWPWLAGNIVIATEPEYGMLHRGMELVHSLHAVLPKGAVGEEPPRCHKQEVLERYGRDEVRAASVALGEEICLSASHIGLLALANKLVLASRRRGSIEDARSLVSAIGLLTAPLGEDTFQHRIKQSKMLANEVTKELRLFGYALEVPTIFDLTQDVIPYFGAACKESAEIAEARIQKRSKEKNEWHSDQAEAIRQSYADLQRPYSFTSNKELRNSPYWPLRTMLTGHSKEKLPGNTLDPQRATEVAGTFRRLVGLVDVSPGDPDQILDTVANDLAKEQQMLDAYARHRSAIVGTIPAIADATLRKRYDVLAELWPTVRTAVKKVLPATTLSPSWYDDIDLVLAMIKEGEV